MLKCDKSQTRNFWGGFWGTGRPKNIESHHQLRRIRKGIIFVYISIIFANLNGLIACILPSKY